MSDLDAARAAKAKLHARLQDDPHVVGIGITKRDGTYVIRVNVSDADTRVPTKIGTFSVERKVVGVIKARPA